MKFFAYFFLSTAILTAKLLPQLRKNGKSVTLAAVMPYISLFFLVKVATPQIFVRVFHYNTA